MATGDAGGCAFDARRFGWQVGHAARRDRGGEGVLAYADDRM